MSDMTLNEYQIIAENTAQYPKEKALEYLVLGLNDESGEVAGKLKKYLRGDLDDKKEKELLLKWQLIHEAGDILWYLAMLCTELNITFERLAIENIEKLQRRADNGTIKGNGDER